MSAARPRPRLILASGSPRRHQLLRSIGLDFTAVAPDIDETPAAGEDPLIYVERLAREKVLVVPAGDDDVVLAADTTVVLEGTILGKPADPEDARRMLRALSGRRHQVHTAVAVRSGRGVSSAVATTHVTMSRIGEQDLEWYVRTGEPLDKAGAYAIQGAGGLFVEAIEGSVSNVTGLPLVLVAELLVAAGWPLSSFRGSRLDPQ